MGGFSFAPSRTTGACSICCIQSGILPPCSTYYASKASGFVYARCGIGPVGANSTREKPEGKCGRGSTPGARLKPNCRPWDFRRCGEAAFSAS
jgi:hypothetical protein